MKNKLYNKMNRNLQKIKLIYKIVFNKQMDSLINFKMKYIRNLEIITQK